MVGKSREVRGCFNLAALCALCGTEQGRTTLSVQSFYQHELEYNMEDEEEYVVKKFPKFPKGGEATNVYAKGSNQLVLSYDKKWYRLLSRVIPRYLAEFIPSRTLRALTISFGGGYRTVGIRMTPHEFGEVRDSREYAVLADHYCVHIPVEEFDHFVEMCKRVQIELVQAKLRGDKFDKEWDTPNGIRRRHPCDDTRPESVVGLPRPPSLIFDEAPFSQEIYDAICQRKTAQGKTIGSTLPSKKKV